MDVLFKQGDWKGINEHITLLSKRRAQLKQAVAAMVKEAMTYIDKVRGERVLGGRHTLRTARARG